MPTSPTLSQALLQQQFIEPKTLPRNFHRIIYAVNNTDFTPPLEQSLKILHKARYSIPGGCYSEKASALPEGKQDACAALGVLRSSLCADYLKPNHSLLTTNNSLPPLSSQHELIAVGVLAHSEVWRLAVLGLRLLIAFATGGDDFGRARDDVRHLKGQAGPSLLALAPAMDRDPAGALA